MHRRRSGSDPSSDRPVVQRRRRSGRDGSPRSDEDEVEVLPDRFDSAGRPVDANDPRRWHSRTGEFEYRPRSGGDGSSSSGPHVQGAWGIHGTDPEMVNRMAQGVGSLLQGRQGWMGMIGNLLTSLPSSSGDGGGSSGHGHGHGMIEDRDDVDNEQRGEGRQRRRQQQQRRHSRRDDDDY